MYQLEVICENCESHFILATRQDIDSQSINCPFCSAIISLDESMDDEE